MQTLYAYRISIRTLGFGFGVGGYSQMTFHVSLGHAEVSYLIMVVLCMIQDVVSLRVIRRCACMVVWLLDH